MAPRQKPETNQQGNTLDACLNSDVILKDIQKFDEQLNAENVLTSVTSLSLILQTFGSRGRLPAE